MGKRVARNRQATTPEVAEVMRGQGVLGSHGAGTPAPLLWIPKTERISYATTPHFDYPANRVRDCLPISQSAFSPLTVTKNRHASITWQV